MTASLFAAAAGAAAGLALAHGWAALGSHLAEAPARADARSHAAARARGVAEQGGPTPLLMLAGAATGWMVLGAVGAALGAAVAGGAVRAGAGVAETRRLRERERGAGALARSLSDTIRAGHSVRGALERAATDRAVPVALRGALQTVDATLRRGASLPSALRGLAEAGGPQLVLLAAVLALHAERGGRLPHTLDALADDADQATRLDEERAAATAQARATVRTVAALPVLALGGAQVVGGNLIGAVAEQPAALALLITGLLLEAIAVFVAQRLVARAA